MKHSTNSVNVASVATDLDGTLTHKGVVPEAAHTALSQLAHRCFVVSVITGRTPRIGEQTLRSLGAFRPDFLALGHGAAVFQRRDLAEDMHTWEAVKDPLFLSQRDSRARVEGLRQKLQGHDITLSLLADRFEPRADNPLPPSKPLVGPGMPWPYEAFDPAQRVEDERLLWHDKNIKLSLSAATASGRRLSAHEFLTEIERSGVDFSDTELISAGDGLLDLCASGATKGDAAEVIDQEAQRLLQQRFGENLNMQRIYAGDSPSDFAAVAPADTAVVPLTADPVLNQMLDTESTIRPLSVRVTPPASEAGPIRAIVRQLASHRCSSSPRLN